jgi:hypothetical protein
MKIGEVKPSNAPNAFSNNTRKQAEAAVDFKHRTCSAAAAAATRHDRFGQTQARPAGQLPLRSQDIDWAGYLSRFMCDESNVRRLTVTKREERETTPAPVNPASRLPSMRCSFCENNGECPSVYMSHPLKDSLGKVVCPILRLYKCPKCGESGDYAHTNKYCPETQRKQKENKIRRCFEATGQKLAQN